VAAALASTLSDRQRPAGVRKFVVQELRWCGGDAEAPALGGLLRDEQLCSDAAMALLAVGGAAAAAQFRAALRDLAGPQRVAVIVALGALKDRESAEDLHRAADRDPDPVARLEAAAALARIASPVSMALLLRLADEARGFDRVRATDACLLLAENYAAAGLRDAAAKIYRHLRDTRNDPSEAYVRDLARAALGE
jgi:HEAT repeat protein